MNIHVETRPLPPDYPFATESRVLALLEIRKEASDEVERLLAIMERIDGDADLEPEFDGGADEVADRESDPAEEGIADWDAVLFERFGEPTLGATEAFNQDHAWAVPAYGHDAGEPEDGDDAEVVCEDEGDDSGDNEHSCGWTGSVDQSRLGGYGPDDENEPELGATEAMSHIVAWKPANGLPWSVRDGEPSLGWTVSEASLGRYSAVRDDREEQCEDEGCNDFDNEDADNGVGDDGGRQEVESEVQIAKDFRLDRASRRATIDPDLMPEQYFVKGDGDCMQPIVMHGDRVLVSKTEAARPGDLVAIYFHRRHVKRGAHQILLKRLYGDGRDGSWKDQFGRPIVMVEMLNPHKLIGFPAESIAAIHRVLKVDNDSPSYRLTQGDMLAAVAIERRGSGNG